MAGPVQSQHQRALKLAAYHLDVTGERDRKKFWRFLQAAVQEAWRGHGKTGKLPRRSPTVKILEKVREVSPSDALALFRKDSPAAQMAATLICCQAVKIATVADITEDDWLGEWWTAATPAQRKKALEGAVKSAGQLREGGREPGTPNGAAFDIFVVALYFATTQCGGKPGSASRDGCKKVSGPMRSALGVLRSVLPKDFIPSEGSILKSVHRAEAYWKERPQVYKRGFDID